MCAAEVLELVSELNVPVEDGELVETVEGRRMGVGSGAAEEAGRRVSVVIGGGVTSTSAGRICEDVRDGLREGFRMVVGVFVISPVRPSVPRT